MTGRTWPQRYEDDGRGVQTMAETRIEKVAFIGLGIMGRAMAANLLKAGFSVKVWNRTAARMQPLVEAGAHAAVSPKDAAGDADVVITIVTDSPDVEQVLLGDDGVVYGAKPGTIVVDMSTISPQRTREMAARLAEKDIHMLDAPVTGGDVGARDGTLSIMVGGEQAVFERCRPVFEAMGRHIVHVGPIGAGQTVKLCNQVIVALNLLAMGEGLALAAKAGVNVEKMLSVVQKGAAGSWALDNLAPRVLRGDYAPGFMVKLQQKDLRLALETAAELNLPLIGTGVVQQLLRSVEAHDGGDDGTQAIVRALERLGNFRLHAADDNRPEN